MVLWFEYMLIIIAGVGFWSDPKWLDVTQPLSHLLLHFCRKLVGILKVVDNGHDGAHKYTRRVLLCIRRFAFSS